jgi:hypothetical protein
LISKNRERREREREGREREKGEDRREDTLEIYIFL